MKVQTSPQYEMESEPSPPDNISAADLQELEQIAYQQLCQQNIVELALRELASEFLNEGPITLTQIQKKIQDLGGAGNAPSHSESNEELNSAELLEVWQQTKHQINHASHFSQLMSSTLTKSQKSAREQNEDERNEYSARFY